MNIPITTARTQLTLAVNDHGLLIQKGYGLTDGDTHSPREGDEQVRQLDFYPTYGDGYLGEPALMVTHADGDISTRLVFHSVKSATTAPDVTLTEIELRDPLHPLTVTLLIRAYYLDDVIQISTRIHNAADRPVTLHRYASAAPVLRAGTYHLAQCSGAYANEANIVTEHLTPGLKILGSNLLTRAARARTPMFLLGLDAPAIGETGDVIVSGLLWPGSYQIGFDLDSTGNLRIVSGAHRVGGDYLLAPGQTLTTPASLWLFSADGAGAATRTLHRWARRHVVRQPDLPRPVLLNNWEATGMKFDETRLAGLFENAKGIGFDTFLLDDGWFGNQHQRDDARRGLGDWEVAVEKLPHGLGYLCEEAEKRGFNFGIWLEPEMISPASELYERHSEWALGTPGREPVLGRWQMVLDLANPDVANFVWQVVDHTLHPHPIKYVKWDANSCVYQPASRYLQGRQGNLDFDYNTALLEVMRRMAREFPHIPGMLCAGGGGRADYASLANFTSFWPSDNTDPLRRVFIQWGYTHFFPPETQSAHVTRMGGRPLKFAVDVALAGALGFDIDITRVTQAEREYFRQTIALYKRDIRPITSRGEYYRLISPYTAHRAAILSVHPTRDQAVLFVYQTADADAADSHQVLLRGLDAAKTYTIREVSIPDGTVPALPADQSFTGSELMTNGLTIPLTNQCESAVVLLTAVEG